MGHHKHCLSPRSIQGFWTDNALDEGPMMASHLPNREQQCQGQFAPTPLQVIRPYSTVLQCPTAAASQEPGMGDTNIQSEHSSLDKKARAWRRLMFSTARLQQPGQLFLLLGLLLVNRLTLLADATDREGDSSFTLSNKVFFMAAGEIFSWSAKCCSSLQWGGGRERHSTRKRQGVWGASFAGFLGLRSCPPCPDAGSLHSID